MFQFFRSTKTKGEKKKEGVSNPARPEEQGGGMGPQGTYQEAERLGGGKHRAGARFGAAVGDISFLLTFCLLIQMACHHRKASARHRQACSFFPAASLLRIFSPREPRSRPRFKGPAASRGVGPRRCCPHHVKGRGPDALSTP